MNSPAKNWKGRDVTRPFWFLTARVGTANCYRCDAPATGFGSNQRPLCCAECVEHKEGCSCYFHFIQRDIARQFSQKGAA